LDQPRDVSQPEGFEKKLGPPYRETESVEPGAVPPTQRAYGSE
jgi:hypothetical protein